MRRIMKRWWNGLLYAPEDPRCLAGGTIRIAAIGGGTGLSTLLRGLKKYSNDISAIVSVTDNGASSGQLRKEFDTLPPGDVRRCLSALAYDEELVAELFEYRFPKNHNSFSGHTLGNIWITGLANIFGSFEKALEVTTGIFKTAGRVLPATLDSADLVIRYEDGSKLEGESHLDEVTKKIKKISLSKRGVKAYESAVSAIANSDLIVLGPGSLYGSLLANLLIPGIQSAVRNNKKAVKVYIANCSTERTQTPSYSVEDHIITIEDHVGAKLFDYCMVNSKVLQTSKDDLKLGEINNISTDKPEIMGMKIVLSDVINDKNPLYHDSLKLAKAVVDLYNLERKKINAKNKTYDYAESIKEGL